MANASRLKLDDEGELDRPSPPPRKAPGDADLRLETVGQDLFKARQRKGKTLSDVWLVLKIRPDYLIAMEEGRFEALPGRVYALGYVRTYAAYLDLDAAHFVQRLKAEMSVRGGPRDYAVDFLPPAERQSPFPQSRTVIASLLSAVLIFTGYHILASAGRTFDQPVMPVPERLASLTQKPAAEPPPLRAELPAPLPRPQPPLPPLPDVTITPPVSIPAELLPRVQQALPPGRRFGVRNRSSRITLRVHRPTQVEVRGTRNRVFIDRALAAGDTYRVPNLVGLRLSAPDAGAVEIILDGSSVGFAGDDGITARALSLNPQNIVDRQRG